MSECPVPRCPSDLCFNSNEFTRESFSVDHFLQEHRNKANLERMRDDLGIYLKVLRSAMIDLINKDYTDFVNLSTNLIGLDKAIDSIQMPLGQLKEELLQVQSNLNEAISEVSSLVEKRKRLEEQKMMLKSASRVNASLTKLSDVLSDGDSLATLQRAATEYSRAQFHVSRCQILLLPSDKQKCDQLGCKLMNIIDGRFISCLMGGYQQSLSSLLGVYLTLGRASEAEGLYRREVVSPAMAQLINEEALAGQPRGLQGLYDSIISFISEEMKPLLILTSPTTNRSSPTIKGFQFLVNSFWPEVEERLEMNLTSIYAPGNPELFYQRFSESLEFLSKLEQNCTSPETLRSLKKHPNYSSFLQRWNLPVYFQIRFQEIAGELESVMSDSDKDMTKSSGGSDFRLLVTETVWKCLLRCWADKVFIPQLGHRFWKLSLQILARYYTWSGQSIEKKTSSADNSSDVDSLVSLYADIERLTEKMPEFFDIACRTLSSNFTISSQISEHLKGSLDESSALLLSRLVGVSGRLVQAVIARSVQALRQVSEVPRLFRRTNRESPVKPSPYVMAVLTPTVAFYRAHGSHQHATGWVRLIFSDITKRYYTSVCDVLASVQKTEESLRRLKKIRDRGGVNTAAGGGERNASADDEKIRLQLYIDVKSYCDQIESLGIEKQDIDQLQGLLNVVQTTQAKPSDIK